MKVFLAGEGRSELGDYSGAREYWPRPGDSRCPGVLEALLLRLGVDVEVIDAIVWKHIRKYKAGDHRSPELRTVRGLLLRASESGADALVFARDRDRETQREAEIDRGISEGVDAHPDVAVVGGAAVEAIEAWILELLGDSRAETYRRPKEQLDANHDVTGLEAMVQIIEETELPSSEGTSSLCRWLGRAERLLDSSR